VKKLPNPGRNIPGNPGKSPKIEVKPSKMPYYVFLAVCID
jgi:hypothetical protein